MSSFSLPTSADRRSLIRWLEECPSPEALAAFESAYFSESMVRLALRHAPSHALAAERIQETLDYAEPPSAKGSKEALLALLANPGISEAQLTQVREWAQRVMLETGTRGAGRAYDAAHPTLLVLEALEERGEPAGEEFFAPFRETLLRPTPKTRKYETSYACFLLERGGDFQEAEMEALSWAVEGISYYEAMLARHPALPLSVLTRMASKGDEYTLLALSTRAEARSNPVIRERLMKRGSFLVLEEMLEWMTPAEFRLSFLRLLGMGQEAALQLLDRAEPGLASELKPQDLLPLFSHAVPQMRLMSQRVWARLQGETSPAPLPSPEAASAPLAKTAGRRRPR